MSELVFFRSVSEEASRGGVVTFFPFRPYFLTSQIMASRTPFLVDSDGRRGATAMDGVKATGRQGTAKYYLIWYYLEFISGGAMCEVPP
jgi:hypothetical protein